MNILTLWVDALLTVALAGFIGLGVLENIRQPKLNFDMVEDVLSLRTMREKFPKEFALVGSNRIENPAFHRFVFALIIIGEGLATVLLILGAFWLAGAALGIVDPAAARFVAVLGALVFTMVWAGFLVGGQWFHYWLAHQPAQFTHFLLVIWGVATLILLMRS